MLVRRFPPNHNICLPRVLTVRDCIYDIPTAYAFECKHEIYFTKCIFLRQFFVFVRDESTVSQTHCRANYFHRRTPRITVIIILPGTVRRVSDTDFRSIESATVPIVDFKYFILLSANTRIRNICPFRKLQRYTTRRLILYTGWFTLEHVRPSPNVSSLNTAQCKVTILMYELKTVF